MKLKSIIIILATLIIGFVIGFLTNGQITKKKIQSFVRMGTSEGFKERLYHVIKPDELQRSEIDPILEKYSIKIHDAIIDSRDEMKSINESMMEELEPYLDEDQIERMEKAHKRMGRGWGEHHPPGASKKGERKQGKRR